MGEAYAESVGRLVWALVNAGGVRSVEIVSGGSKVVESLLLREVGSGPGLDSLVVVVLMRPPADVVDGGAEA